MGENPLDFWRKIVEKVKKVYKNRRNKLATMLLITMVCFFYGDYIKISEVRGAKADEVRNSLKITKDWNINNAADYKFLLDNTEDIKNLGSENLEKQLKNITKDHPIEEMAPFIAEYDRKIAALIIGIAKKESNWGLHSPSKNGNSCYNYWGYKGQGSAGSYMGYSCFGSPEEAVHTIGNRISQLVNKNIDTPAKMVVWKCGSSCAATGGQAAANKWVADVNVYFKKIAMIAS